MDIWKMICSNKLLAPVNIILLLNKLDILHHKLESGIMFSKYVTSYKTRENKMEPVSKCKSSPKPDLVIR